MTNLQWTGVLALVATMVFLILEIGLDIVEAPNRNRKMARWAVLPVGLIFTFTPLLNEIFK